jgi:hypothetical protein
VDRRKTRRIGFICVLVTGALGGAACGTTEHSGSAPTSTTSAVSKPLSSPEVSPAEDGAFLTDVTEVDPALATYVQSYGNVAVRALLTDGSAFCAFLQRGGGINNAMVSVAIGARSVESQTHLPSTVTTFNTLEAVALLTLCPGEQKLVPPSDRSRISDLGKTLAQPAS